MKRFTPADWPEVIVPTLERELGPQHAARAIKRALARAGEDSTTGLRVRALIASREHRVLQALDKALNEIAAR